MRNVSHVMKARLPASTQTRYENGAPGALRGTAGKGRQTICPPCLKARTSRLAAANERKRKRIVFNRFAQSLDIVQPGKRGDRTAQPKEIDTIAGHENNPECPAALQLLATKPLRKLDTIDARHRDIENNNPRLEGFELLLEVQ